MRVLPKIFMFIILLISSSITIIIILVLVFHFNPQGSGSSRELTSINESKKYGVFVEEYYNPKNEIIFMDNKKLEIDEAWIEKDWIYNNWSMPKVTNKGVYGLCLVFKKNVDIYFKDKITFQWNGGKRGFALQKEQDDKTWNIVSIWSKRFNNEDTLMVFATKYSTLTKNYDTLTSFILIKKS